MNERMSKGTNVSNINVNNGGSPEQETYAFYNSNVTGKNTQRHLPTRGGTSLGPEHLNGQTREEA